MTNETLDEPTRHALLATAEDLTRAVQRAVERSTDLPRPDAISRACAIWDAINRAVREVQAI